MISQYGCHPCAFSCGRSHHQLRHLLLRSQRRCWWEKNNRAPPPCDCFLGSTLVTPLPAIFVLLSYTGDEKRTATPSLGRDDGPNAIMTT